MKGDRCVSDNEAPYFDFNDEDAALAQRVGAALMMHWASVPSDLRGVLIDTAAEVGIAGVEPQAHQDMPIKALITRFSGG